jgi:hypothetical protein
VTNPAILRAALAGALASIVLACGGGDDGGVVPRLLCSGATAPAPDQVALGCPADGVDSITVAVHLGGPTTSGDIYGLEFDLVFDPTVVQFEPPAMEGSFLNQDGAATIVQAGAMEGEPGRLIVAIARQGEPNGVRAAGADQVVMTLLFRGVAAGSTTLAFENAAVVDSSLQPIPGIGFGTPLMLTFD